MRNNIIASQKSNIIISRIVFVPITDSPAIEIYVYHVKQRDPKANNSVLTTSNSRTLSMRIIIRRIDRKPHITNRKHTWHVIYKFTSYTYLNALTTHTTKTMPTMTAIRMRINIFLRYLRWYSAAFASSSTPASTPALAASIWLSTVSKTKIIY